MKIRAGFQIQLYGVTEEVPREVGRTSASTLGYQKNGIGILYIYFCAADHKK